MKYAYWNPNRVFDGPEQFGRDSRLRITLDNDRHVTLMMDLQRAPSAPQRIVVDRANTDGAILAAIYDVIQGQQNGYRFTGLLGLLYRWRHNRSIPTIEELERLADMELVVDDAHESPVHPLKEGVPLYLRIGMRGSHWTTSWHTPAVIESIEQYEV